MDKKGERDPDYFLYIGAKDKETKNKPEPKQDDFPF